MKKKLGFDFSVYRFFFWFVFFVKIIIFLIWKSQGNIIEHSDADYYEWFAEGLSSGASSGWPVFLRFLNGYGLFDRVGLSYFLFTIGALWIPLLFAKVATMALQERSPKVYWLSAFLAGLYPSLNYMYLDIFRDVVMVLFFLLFLYFFLVFLKNRNVLNLLLALVFVWFCYILRGYLGVAIGLSFFVVLGFSLFPNFKFKYFFMLHVVILFLLNNIGMLHSFHEYRQGDSFKFAGSSLGITLEGTGVMFLPLYLYSYIAQVLGVFFINLKAVAVFFAESLIFVFLVWRQKNYGYSEVGYFGAFLLAFSVVYSSVFVLANDNLGTALRLRIYVYLSVFLVQFCKYGRERKDNVMA